MNIKVSISLIDLSDTSMCLEHETYFLHTMYLQRMMITIRMQFLMELAKFT